MFTHPRHTAGSFRCVGHSLSYFNPIAPRKAAELVDLADLGHAPSVLADFAVAGLVKAYARIIETDEADGRRTEVRDSRISRDLWRRICAEGKVDDIWATGTVRLPGSDLRGGAPAVSLIGIRFDDKSLQNVIAQHSGHVGTAVPPKQPELPAVHSASLSPPLTVGEPKIEPVKTTAAPMRVGIPEGAITVTVKEVMAATGLGRTTIDKLMGNGTLERIKVGGRALITVESIKSVVSQQR
ncbi:MULTISPECIES: hypothetical protein [unclassified Sphingomonas]|uniref:helix-turn-helix transcriptional regulator n=1 Tax=unclassified Sphingomonas TaxID=196159 RepID=UPI00226A97E8|nr:MULTISPECIES: hypothetical protein [unclassified Sphingomonas]